MNIMERRMGASVIEVRDNDSDGVTFTGYASTFNEPYDMGWYTETVDPGAFKRTLGRNPDVRFLINHEGLPLARTTSGTLILDTDSKGLRVQANLDPTDPDVVRLLPKWRRGDLNQMSFAFRIEGADGDKWSDDFTKRALLACDINDGDVSSVTYPANGGAFGGARSEGPNVEAITSALRVLERRDASEEDVVSVLTRALGYFTAIDLVVDQAQEELASVLSIPNPDDDEMESMTEQDAARKAKAELEARLRLLSA